MAPTIKNIKFDVDTHILLVPAIVNDDINTNSRDCNEITPEAKRQRKIHRFQWKVINAMKIQLEGNATVQYVSMG